MTVLSLMNSKKNKIFLTFLMFATFNGLYSQNSVDSISYYYQNGDISKSIKFAQQLQSKYIENKDTLNYNFADLVLFSAKSYRKLNKNTLAEKNYKNAISILEKYREKDQITIALYKNCLALLYKDTNRFNLAEPIFQEVFEIRKKFLKGEDTDYIYCLLNLADASKKIKNYDKSEKLYNEGIILQRKVFGDNHFSVAITLNSLAQIYFEKGKYLEAENSFKQSLEIYKLKYTETNLGYINIYNNYGMTLRKLGRYDEAKSIFLDIIELKSKLFKVDDPEFNFAILNLAEVYQNIGDNKTAEKYYFKILNNIDENDDNYCLALNNLALLYNNDNQRKEAESLFLKCVLINKNKFGIKSFNYATSIDNLASFYQDILNYNEAEKLYLEALNIRQSISINHPDLCFSYQHLSSLYLSLHLDKKAEEYRLLHQNIFENIYGKNHPDYSFVLNDLANSYFRNGNYIEAKKLYIEADNIISKNFKSNYSFHKDLLYNLGNVCYYQEEYTTAKEYYLKVIELSLNNFDYRSFKMLALIEDLGNNLKQASIYYDKLFTDFINTTKYSFSYLSHSELRPFIKKYFEDRFFPISFLNRYPTQYPEINMGCYENELLVKNLSLRNQQRIKISIEKSNDALLKSKYQQFIDNKRQIAKLEELPIDKRSQDYESLKIATEIIEKDLTRQSSAFADAKKSLSVTWKAVQDKLQPNEVAIDLVAYNYYNRKWTDSIVYAAFVVGKDFKAPKYIPLFEQKQLELLIERNSKEDDTLQAKKLNKQYLNKAISNLFFKPLEKELEGKTTLYLSPAGLGHQIDFSALPVSETQTLGEKYQVHVLGSTAELVSYSAARLDKSKSLELLLYGGIYYGKSHPNAGKKQELIEDNNAIAELRTRSGISEFNYLPGTNDEVNQIAQLGKESGFVSTILNKDDATEESIKQLDGRTTPYVLHLATHGFFFADPKQELPKDKLLPDSKVTIYKTADDPMMRSGLLFAGANKYWNTTTENLTTDDGILNANEISNLDLSACQLVVLSACETGLGTINGSEGVFGLQRAFKMAGVKNIIMSLWKVPDAQTAELFSVFYKECLGGKSIHEAFQLAQAKMRAKYSPFYWAGFVLLE